MVPLEIPALSLVVLVGASDTSDLARRLFRSTEVLSLSAFRAMVADGQPDPAAAEVLQLAAATRLRNGLLAVVATSNPTPAERRACVTLAKRAHVLPVALVLESPGYHPGHLEQEGFKRVHLLGDPEATRIVRAPLPMDHRADPGPFDLIGDVHGCSRELEELLRRLGYEDGVPPSGRKAVFVGDLVDRGPAIAAVLRRAMAMVADGHALCVTGNHDDKLLRALRGRQVQVSHGLEDSLEQLALEPPGFRELVAAFLEGLPSHLLLDGGRLCVAHGGLLEHLQGRMSDRVRAFCLYGDATGKLDRDGLPERRDWAAGYRGSAAVVYGHTPVAAPVWVNNTLNLDTGCVFGGALTALRWPEGELVQVPAPRAYAEPRRPLGT